MGILGIDLGTTNSLGAMYIDGEVAKERLITHPDRSFASFKRNM